MALWYQAVNGSFKVRKFKNSLGHTGPCRQRLSTLHSEHVRTGKSLKGYSYATLTEKLHWLKKITSLRSHGNLNYRTLRSCRKIHSSSATVTRKWARMRVLRLQLATNFHNECQRCSKSYSILRLWCFFQCKICCVSKFTAWLQMLLKTS